MKKFLSILLAALMLCGSVCTMASCNEKDADEGSSSTSGNAEATAGESSTTTADVPLDKAYNNYLSQYKFDDSGKDTLTVALSPDFAPMEFTDTAKSGQDKYVGFDPLLAQYLAKELDMKLVIKPMSFDACMTAVQTGAADLGISGFSWTAERAEKFLISDYYIAGENETEQIIITTKANEGKWTTKEDFAGKKIGAQGGSLQELLVKETFGADSLKLYTDLTVAVEALLTGKIDALAVAAGNGDAFISKNPDKLGKTGYEFEVEEKYKNNVILLNQNDSELLEKVNAALAKAMSADLYDGWYEACQIYSQVKTADELGYDDNGNKITNAD